MSECCACREVRKKKKTYIQQRSLKNLNKIHILNKINYNSATSKLVL